MDIEHEKDMAATADKVMSHAGDPEAQRIALLASFRLFYSKGYQAGYGDAMRDAECGRDRRVSAHLN